MGRGWCSTHYTRWWRHGDPLTVKRRLHVIQHGTYNEYGNYGCRCDACKRANAEYQAQLYKTDHCSNCEATIWHRGNAPVTGLCQTCLGESRRTAEHGTESRYASGCRCAPCREAGNTARRARRAANREAARAYDREYKRSRRQVAT